MGEAPESAVGPSSMTQESLAVTIITPCLNAEKFLVETIESVVQQDYPNFEYIVLDGGSTDGTIAILERYAALYPKLLRYISEPDAGASDAIAKGFAMAKGEVFAYLNADDTYFPGAIRTAISHLRDQPKLAGVYGNAYWISAEGDLLGNYPTKPFHPEELGRECFICQPTCFVRCQAIREVGGFDPRLHSAFDYDLWLRLSRHHQLFRIEALLASSRMHLDNKTLSGRGTVFREAIACVRRHFGYVPFQWIHGYCSYLVDGRDQFFEPLRPSFTKFAFSLLLGTVCNWRHPLRYWREWCSIMSPDAFVRRWNSTWIARRMGIQIR